MPDPTRKTISAGIHLDVEPGAAEIWKGIPGYPGYQASNLGRVRSLDRTLTYIRDGQAIERRLHRDDNPANNKLENLRWGTRRENFEDYERNYGRPQCPTWKATHCKRGHPFDEANTRRSPRQRSCRICSKQRSRDYRRAHHA